MERLNVRTSFAAIPAPVLETVRTLSQAGYQAFLVGGCVRDLLRAEAPKDFDVATSARPTDVQKLFRRVIPTGIDHGTVTVVLGGTHVEVTTFRAEAEYVDGRRPSKVEFHSDIEADLSRRDFTINAMAFDPLAQRLVDPFGGQADLDGRVVRCVGVAVDRFLEDGLRPLRAVRFATVLGFSVEAETEAALSTSLHVFRKVALERINQEFTKILLAPRAALGLDLLERSGLLATFFSEAENLDAVDQVSLHLPLRLAVLTASASAPKETVLRLKYPTKVAADVGHLVASPPPPPMTASDANVRRWLSKVKAEYAMLVLEWSNALGRGGGPAARERVERILAQNPALTTKALALNGEEIMRALAVGPSPKVGEAAAYLLECVLENPEVNSRSGLLEALKSLKSFA